MPAPSAPLLAHVHVPVADDEDAIARAAGDATILLIVATERGHLSRLFRGSMVMDVVDEVDCSVLLAERARKRGLVERLFGD